MSDLFVTVRAINVETRLAVFPVLVTDGAGNVLRFVPTHLQNGQTYQVQADHALWLRALERVGAVEILAPAEPPKRRPGRPKKAEAAPTPTPESVEE